jgi:hypothetical protein
VVDALRTRITVRFVVQHSVADAAAVVWPLAAREAFTRVWCAHIVQVPVAAADEDADDDTTEMIPVGVQRRRRGARLVTTRN